MEISGLPFRFVIDGDTSSGDAAQLTVQIASSPSDEALDQLHCAVSWFAKLGSYGGLGGESISPDRVVAKLRNEDKPDANNTRTSWHFENLCVAPSSMVILGNLIGSTGLDVREVRVTANGPSSEYNYSSDEYPQAFPRLPFEVEENRVDRNVEIAIDFAEDLTANQSESICDVLRVWTLIGALGGFRVKKPFRKEDRMDLTPEDDPEVILDELTFCLRDFGVHDAAYSVLVNLVHWYSISSASVSSLRIG